MYDLLSFLLFLKDNLKAPGSIKNYFSSVKLWVKAGPGTAAAFDTPEIKVMKRGISKSSTHIISKAPGIPPIEFKMIIDFLFTLTPPPCVLISSLLISYYTLARQRNIVLTGPSVDTSPHVLLF